MIEHIASPATLPEYDLAEGVLWDDRAQRVRWVDIWNGRVLSATLAGDRLADVTEIILGETAGAVALADDGGLLVAGARGMVTVGPSGELSYGPDLLGDRRQMRFNDGSVDPLGALVVGTLALDDRADSEVLLRVHANGTVETLREGLGLSNGIAFSPDGSTIYHVDTLAGTVSSRPYGRDPIDRQELWTTVVADLPSPDGLTVDSTGALWVALWGSSSVRRYSPSGEELAIVHVDAAQVSCPAFIGPRLDTLAITSAREGLDVSADHAGAIFLAHVGVSGLRANRWSGSTTAPYWLSPQPEEDIT